MGSKEDTAILCKSSAERLKKGTKDGSAKSNLLQRGANPECNEMLNRFKDGESAVMGKSPFFCFQSPDYGGTWKSCTIYLTTKCKCLYEKARGKRYFQLSSDIISCAAFFEKLLIIIIFSTVFPSGFFFKNLSTPYRSCWGRQCLFYDLENVKNFSGLFNANPK